MSYRKDRTLEDYLIALGDMTPTRDICGRPFLHDKDGKIIYCHFCSNHPNYPRKEPAVTYTQDGTPRCGPCGRWVE